jgi:hypothetical protein
LTLPHSPTLAEVTSGTLPKMRTTILPLHEPPTAHYRPSRPQQDPEHRPSPLEIIARGSGSTSSTIRSVPTPIPSLPSQSSIPTLKSSPSSPLLGLTRSERYERKYRPSSPDIISMGANYISQAPQPGQPIHLPPRSADMLPLELNYSTANLQIRRFRRQLRPVKEIVKELWHKMFGGSKGGRRRGEERYRKERRGRGG